MPATERGKPGAVGSNPTGPAKLLKILVLALLDAHSLREVCAIGEVELELSCRDG